MLVCFDTSSSQADTAAKPAGSQGTVVSNDSLDGSTVELLRWSICKDITEGCVGAWLGG